MKLFIKEGGTWLKTSTADSTQLGNDEKVWVPAKTKFDLHSHVAAERNHVRVALLNTALGPQNLNTWYAFGKDIFITGNEPGNDPNDPYEKPRLNRGDMLVLPNQEIVYLKDPIIAGGHFYWAEATKNGSRPPEDMEVVNNVRRIAEHMEEVRSRLDDRPVFVTSWYRPYDVNIAVGGARNSRHVDGDSVDFVVDGLIPQMVFRILEPWWGSRGGLASTSPRRKGSGFTHIDARGYTARWQYGV